MDKKENLRNEIDVDVNYVDDSGNRGIKRVHIMFVTQGIYKEYTNLVNDLLEVVRLNNRLQDITKEMGESVANRVSVVKNDEGELETVRKGLGVVRDEIKKLQREYEDTIARLNGLNEQTAVKKYDLIRHILKKNCISDADMESSEWWDECTDMSAAMSFIHDVCHKDDENVMNKKKVQAVMKSST